MNGDLDSFERFCGMLAIEDGSPLELYPEQRTMLTELFGGASETVILLPKKNGKSTLLGALALYHACTTPDAECVIAAASRDQAQIMLRQAQGFIRRSRALQKALHVKQREIIHRKLGGRVRVLASDVDTADGVIPTLALVDELHRHKSADLYGVFRDGLGPRRGQLVTISTAGDDEESPLGLLRARAYKMPGLKRERAYRHVSDGSFALHEWALDDSEQADDLAAVKDANPAPWQTPEALRERYASPSMTPWQWARFAAGVWGLGVIRAFDPERWTALERADTTIEPGALVTLGFDGSRRWDATGLVACDVKSGHLQVVGVWERPHSASEDWEIPEAEVTKAVNRAFKTWDVWRLYADPPYWESTVDAWAGEHGSDKVVRWWTNRQKAMALALHGFRTDMRPGVMSHDGDADLARHIGNAVQHDTKMREGEEFLWLIRKASPKSPHKIDLAMAACLAWKARGDAIETGLLNDKPYRRARW